MVNKFQYRLSKNQKEEIAQNLIDILQKGESITKQTKNFIVNWIRTGPDEKRKAFFDVWDIVLKNYLPTTRPVLFRSCERTSNYQNGKIASFTGRLECARRFSGGIGSLIICDTQETLLYEEEFLSCGEYMHTFYPLVNVLKQALDSGGCEFSKETFKFIGEDEYIMRINLASMYCLKWVKKRF